MEITGTFALRFFVTVGSSAGEKKDIGELVGILKASNLEDAVETAVWEMGCLANNATIRLIQLDSKFEQSDKEELDSAPTEEELWGTVWETIISTTKSSQQRS